MRFCTQCGARLEPGARFCTQCGATIEHQPSAPQPPVDSEAPTQFVGASAALADEELATSVHDADATQTIPEQVASQRHDDVPSTQEIPQSDDVDQHRPVSEDAFGAANTSGVAEGPTSFGPMAQSPQAAIQGEGSHDRPASSHMQPDYGQTPQA